MIQLFQEDCREVILRIPNGSVDLILQDPPYGVTKNAWDKKPDLAAMWPEWWRILKPNGAAVFTAQQPFSTELIVSQMRYFRYEIIWFKKGKVSGFLNANKMPLRAHETVLVFYKKQPGYYPQMTQGKPNHSRGGNHSRKKQTNNNYGKVDPSFKARITAEKHPLSVWEIEAVRNPLHPTQKPVELMRRLIRSYTQPGDTIFDGYAGMAPVAIACILDDRNYIGAESDPSYYQLATAEITKYQAYETATANTKCGEIPAEIREKFAGRSGSVQLPIW